MPSRFFVSVIVLALLTTTAASAQTARRAPEPTKRVDVERLYLGRWHEIARRPMRLTDGCVAGATDYSRGASGEIQVLDSCRVGSPDGEWRTISGPGTIQDPGVNAKLRVDYTLFGVIPIRRDYWILDRAPDYSWFISADPGFEDLYVFTRNPRVPPAQLRRLLRRAQSFGYDIRQLEIPAQPSR